LYLKRFARDLLPALCRGGDRRGEPETKFGQ
jgi:hypothetical protein